MTAFANQATLLTWRSLRALPRVPERLLDVTLQPIIFILLFRYVFGSAIHTAGISYSNFLVPGIIGQGLAFGIMSVGTATSHDMQEGVLDRFRSMPVNRLAIVTGQVLGQFCEQILGLTIYAALGLLIGWRLHCSVLHGVEMFGLILLAMFAFAWMGAFFGMLVRSPDAMQGVGFIIVFPLSFMAGTFVPIQGMALIPRTIGEWDPISALVATVRKLSEGYQAHGSWLLDHCELAMLVWALLMLAVFVPLALRRFNRRLAA